MNKCPLPALLLAALLLQPVALWAEAPQPPTAETAATVSVDQLRELAARAASAGNFSAALDYTRQVEDRYADDELLHRSTLTFQEKARGTEDLSLVIPLNKLANLYMRQGRYAEAEQLFRRKLALVEKAGGNGQPRVMAESLSDLAWSYREQGRYADAEPL
ncbi:tetratricopeptide repeat protein, partial [Candidatus Accumulibacter vicinus]